MAPPMNPTSPRPPSSRTRAKTLRISNTQFILLESPAYKKRASALVRVLLTLYFNKKLTAFSIDSLLENELREADRAILVNGEKFREMLRKQAAEKKTGT
jgi:hypothetical protein